MMAYIFLGCIILFALTFTVLNKYEEWKRKKRTDKLIAKLKQPDVPENGGSNA